VSGHDQKEDLKRQAEELEQYCKAKNYKKIERISGIGSGLNYQKKGLRRLLEKIMLGEVKRIVITYPDRLLRFGLELLEKICNFKEVEIESIYPNPGKSEEAKFVEDVLAILMVYSAKIHGKRAHAVKQAHGG